MHWFAYTKSTVRILSAYNFITNYKTSIASISLKGVELSGSTSTGFGKLIVQVQWKAHQQMIRWSGNLGRIWQHSYPMAITAHLINWYLIIYIWTRISLAIKIIDMDPAFFESWRSEEYDRHFLTKFLVSNEFYVDGHRYPHFKCA